jgi:hypothetical protein
MDQRVLDLLDDFIRRDPTCLLPLSGAWPYGPGQRQLTYTAVCPGDGWTAEDLAADFEDGQVLLLCGPDDRPMAAILEGGCGPTRTRRG